MTLPSSISSIKNHAPTRMHALLSLNRQPLQALARMGALGLRCRDVRTREAGIQDIHHQVGATGKFTPAGGGCGQCLGDAAFRHPHPSPPPLTPTPPPKTLNVNVPPRSAPTRLSWCGATTGPTAAGRRSWRMKTRGRWEVHGRCRLAAWLPGAGIICPTACSLAHTY